MQSFGADEEERDDAGSYAPTQSCDLSNDPCTGSQNGSSDNDADEHMDDMDDADAEAEADPDADGEGEGENDEEEDDNEDDDDQQDGEESQDPFLDSPVKGQNRIVIASRPDSGSTSSQGSTGLGAQGQSGPTSHPNPTVLFTAASPGRSSSSTTNAAAVNLPGVRPEALTAPVYDIVPTIAAPHSTSINAITATPDLRWVFSGGADGYIRKFNWVETANGKVMLTVAQRHPFVDSVTKAGVLMSYWENEEPQCRYFWGAVAREASRPG